MQIVVLYYNNYTQFILKLKKIKNKKINFILQRYFEFVVVFKTKLKSFSFRHPEEEEKMVPYFKRLRRFVDVTNGVCLPLGKNIPQTITNGQKLRHRIG